MSNNVEKLLRLTVLMEVFYICEKAIEDADATALTKKFMEQMEKIRHLVLNMRISPCSDASVESVYHFTRVPKADLSRSGPLLTGGDDGEWKEAA